MYSIRKWVGFNRIKTNYILIHSGGLYKTIRTDRGQAKSFFDQLAERKILLCKINAPATLKFSLKISYVAVCIWKNLYPLSRHWRILRGRQILLFIFRNYFNLRYFVKSIFAMFPTKSWIFIPTKWIKRLYIIRSIYTYHSCFN